MGPEALDFSGSRPAVLIYARSAQSLEERLIPLKLTFAPTQRLFRYANDLRTRVAATLVCRCVPSMRLTFLTGRPAFESRFRADVRVSIRPLLM
jgi:hypothetical protein